MNYQFITGNERCQIYALTKAEHTISDIAREMKKVNIREELDSITKHWSQKVIGEANGSLYKVANGIGEPIWPKLDDQDELFIIYKGSLTIQLRNMSIELKKKCLLFLEE